MKILYVVSIFIYFYYIFYKSKKYMHMLQQNWYNDGNRYLKWIKDNFNKVFINIEILFVILYFFKGYAIFIVFNVLYIISYVLFNNTLTKEQSKKPLVITPRIKRLYTTMTILYLIPCILIYMNFDIYDLDVAILSLGLLCYFNPLMILLANIINKPIEKIIFEHFKIKAKKKLKNMKNLKKIAITGSYGKTTTKNILNDILSVKYNSFATEKSFNTMNGLMISINNKLDKFCDIFVAEMGAFRKGEIKEKCKFIKPQYGIITTIGKAHLESFGNIHNTQKAKFELIDSLPDDGVAVLNMDDEYQTSYESKSKCKKYWISMNKKDADLYAYDIELSAKGTKFRCKFKNEEKSEVFETKLLGRENIYNILEGMMMAYALGMNTNEIALGLKRIKPVEHRLELIEYDEHITIIDDAYNSNPVGSRMAIEVLSMMEGKKIIVTPGMIELGDEQNVANRELGHYIAKVCDEVILIGLEQTKPIYNGLQDMQYKEDNIHILNDVKKAFPLMKELAGKEKTYVLLENDLPDIFNE